MRLAGLDLGSNTIKITVAEIEPGGALKVLGEKALITRVGEGLDRTRRISPEAMERTLSGLRELVDFARSLGAEEIGCVGTAGLRDADNSPDFLARAKDEHALDVEIIDGLREAELAFRAPAMAYGPGPIIVTDLGGRSTEVVTGTGRGIEARVSLAIGTVRLTERFLAHDPPEQAELEALRAHLAEALGAAPAAAAEATLIGVSGTVLSLAGLQLDVDAMEDAVRLGEGVPIRRDWLEATARELAKKTAKARIRGTVLPPGRADVIVAGAEIVLALMDRYRCDAMTASNRGVRYGLLYELAGRAGAR